MKYSLETKSHQHILANYNVAVSLVVADLSIKIFVTVITMQFSHQALATKSKKHSIT